MKIRQKVQHFDALNLAKQRLEQFISNITAKNSSILDYDENHTSEETDHEEVVASRKILLDIIDSKKAEVQKIAKELKDLSYYFKTASINLDRYRSTNEDFNEE